MERGNSSAAKLNARNGFAPSERLFTAEAQRRREKKGMHREEGREGVVFSSFLHPSSFNLHPCIPRASRLVPLFALCFFAALPIAAQVDPFSKIGFEPNDAVNQIGNDTINPLTGLLVRNETLLGPFTAPNGYQWTVVAHYNGPTWRAYAKWFAEGEGCKGAELHRPNSYGSLGVGWTAHMGVIHLEKQLIRQFSYESATGEIIYFYKDRLHSEGNLNLYFSTDGLYRLERRESPPDPDCDPTQPGMICESTSTFVLYSPGGTQTSFTQRAVSNGTDMSGYYWNDWYATTIKTMAGDVINIAYDTWEIANDSGYYGSRANLASISDGTRTVTFTNQPLDFTLNGETRSYKLTTGLEISGRPETSITLSYTAKAIGSPFWAASPLNADYFYESSIYQQVAQRPRPFLTRISYPESISLDYTYNTSGCLETFHNPQGGTVTYSYGEIATPGPLFAEVLGAVLAGFGFGGEDMPCDPDGSPTANPSARTIDLSIPDEDARALVSLPAASTGIPEEACYPMNCTIYWNDCDEHGCVVSWAQGPYCNTCGFSGPGGGGTGGGGTGGGGGGGTCPTTPWMYRQIPSYGIFSVNRDGAVWNHLREFDGSYDPLAPRRVVTVSQPDGTSIVYDYGGTTQDKTMATLYSPNNADRDTRLLNLQYLYDYVSGRPRSTETHSVSSAVLGESRFVYDSDDICYEVNGTNYWTLDVDDRTTREASRLYRPDGSAVETLSAYDLWDSQSKAFKQKTLSSRVLDATAAAVLTTDAEMENPSLWKVRQTAEYTFDPPVDEDLGNDTRAWLLPRLRTEKVTDSNGDARLTETARNGRGQVVWEIRRINPLGTAHYQDLVLKYTYGTEGDLKRVDYGRGGVATSSPSYQGCGLTTGGGSPQGTPLPTWDFADTWLLSAPDFATASNTTGADIAWSFGYPVSMKWDGILYDELCRTWDGPRGLATQDVDPNGAVSTYAWDDVGRLETIQKSFGGESETTSVTWQAPDHAVVTDACGDSAHYLYDDFGRLRETWRKFINVAGSTAWSVQAQTYDEMGRVKEKTDWFAATGSPDPIFEDISNIPNIPTAVYTYDSLGRVIEVNGPADFRQTTAYDGWTQTVKTWGINEPQDDTAASCPVINSVTKYYFDPLGRLVIVDAPDGGADAIYKYNVAGQLLQASLGAFASRASADTAHSTYLSGTVPSFSGIFQTRSFDYDSVGALMSESHPENGVTTYLNYDALGNLLSYRDAKGQTVTLSYDSKGRKTGISSGGAWSSWVYDEVSDPLGISNGWSKNRLTRSVSHAAAAISGQSEVIEVYKYLGRLGRLNEKHTDVLSHVFVQTYGYDSCGRPDLENALVGPEGDQASFNVNSEYAAGLLRNKYFSGAQVHGGVHSPITYNPSLSPYKVPYYVVENGAVQQNFSAAHREQPNLGRALGVSLLWNGGLLWGVGDYSYDKAGNIIEIGRYNSPQPDSFEYDAHSRLSKATVNHRPGVTGTWVSPRFAYSFDLFGNLHSRQIENLSAVFTQIPEAAAAFQKEVEFSTAATAESVRLSSNRLTEVTRAGIEGGIGASSCSNRQDYDSNGNLTAIYDCEANGSISTTPRLEMVYNPFNQMVKARRPFGSSLSKDDHYFYNADGERVAAIGLTSGSLAGVNNSSYFLRSGPQVAAEEKFTFDDGVFTSDRRKAYLYVGSNLAATEEWEDALGGGTGGGAQAQMNMASRYLCGRIYTERFKQQQQVRPPGGGSQLRLPSLSDPSVTPRPGQKYSVSYTLRDISGDLAGAMVRLARLKPQGSGNGGTNGGGNGTPRDDEDKVECRYFLADGQEADFVFRHFGLQSNGSYGTVEALASGAGAFFEDLQAEKTYRVTFVIWTRLGADPLLGFNRVGMTEGQLMIPRENPPLFLEARHQENENGDGDFETVLRAVWDRVPSPGLLGYNLVGQNGQGQRLVLNDALLEGEEFEAPLARVRARGLADGSTLTVESVLAGGTGEVIGPLPKPVAMDCGPGGGGLGDLTGPPCTPYGVMARNLPTASGPRVFVTWQKGSPAGALFRVFRVRFGFLEDCRTPGLTYEQIGETPASYYIDTAFTEQGIYGYEIQAVNADGTQVSGMSACASANTAISSAPPAPAWVRASNLSGPSSPRRVLIEWEPLSLFHQNYGDYQYALYRAYRPTGPDSAACSDFADSEYQLIATANTPWEDWALSGLDANPLVSYRVVITHNILGDLSPPSQCEWTHAANCPELPWSPLYPDDGYDAGTNEAILSWTPGPDAGAWTTYWVYEGDLLASPSSASFKSRGSATSLRIYAGTWPGGTTLTYSLVAADTRSGCRSLPAVATITVPPNSGCHPPGAPVITGALEGMSAARITWEAVQDWQGQSVSGYRLERRSGSYGTTGWEVIQEWSALTYLDEQPGGGTFSYRVTAIDAQGCESVPSNCVTVEVPPPPDPPQNLTIASSIEGVNSTANVVTLTWNGVTGAELYRVERKNSVCGYGIPWTLAGTSPSGYFQETLPYTGLTVSYRVTAIYPGGMKGPPSGCAWVSIPTATSHWEADGVPPTMYFYVWDHLGTTRVVINAGSTLWNESDHEPFGLRIPPFDNPSGNTHQFTGQEYDETTEMSYFHARHLGSSLGRFTRPDPLNGSAETPQSWNKYTYTNNNPVMFLDATGAAPFGALSEQAIQRNMNAEQAERMEAVNLRLALDVAKMTDSFSWGQDTAAAFIENKSAAEKVEAIIVDSGRTASVALDAIGIRVLAKGAISLGKSIAKKLFSKAAVQQVSTQFGKKIEKQLVKRGWTKQLVKETVEHPAHVVDTRDVRHLPGGGQLNDPAKAYIDKQGQYVVRNEKTGDVVQVSDRNDPNWKSPFGP